MVFLLVGSILLVSSAYGSVFPYHGSLGLIPPATDVIITADPLGASIVQPLVLSPKPAPATVVAGPSSGATVIKGSVAGPVTLTAGSSVPTASGVVPVLTIGQDPSEGSIALVSPSDGSITVTEGLTGVTSTSVVGPSTGPVVITGPSAVSSASIPAVPPVPVPRPIRIFDTGVGVISSTGGSVLVNGATSGPTVIEGSTAGPFIQQELLDNTILVTQPEIKLVGTPTAEAVVSPGSGEVAVLGPTANNIAIAGSRATSTVISGPSGTITTSGRK